MSFGDLYDDILLKLASEYIELKDIVTFSLICKRILLLLSSCTFWVNTLNHLEQFHPLSCPLNYDLQELDLSSLKRLFSRTMSIWQTTERLSGDIINLSHTIECKDAEEILLLIPGTNLVVFAEDLMHGSLQHLSRPKKLVCLDVVTGEEKVSCNTTAFWFSSGCNPSKNRYFMGGLAPTTNGGFSLVCLDITHDARRHSVTMECKSCRSTVPLLPATVDPIAVDDEVIVLGQSMEGELQLFAENMTNGHTCLIKTTIATSQARCIDFRFHKRTLLITLYYRSLSFGQGSTLQYRLYSCPKKFLPYNNTAGYPTILSKQRTLSFVAEDHFIHEFHFKDQVQQLYRRVVNDGPAILSNITQLDYSEISCYSSPLDPPDSPLTIVKILSKRNDDWSSEELRYNMRNMSTVFCGAGSTVESFNANAGIGCDIARIQLVQFQPSLGTGRVREFVLPSSRIVGIRGDFAYDESMGYVVVVCNGVLDVYRFA